MLVSINLHGMAAVHLTIIAARCQENRGRHCQRSDAYMWRPADCLKYKSGRYCSPLSVTVTVLSTKTGTVRAYSAATSVKSVNIDFNCVTITFSQGRSQPWAWGGLEPPK